MIKKNKVQLKSYIVLLALSIPFFVFGMFMLIYGAVAHLDKPILIIAGIILGITGFFILTSVIAICSFKRAKTKQKESTDEYVYREQYYQQQRTPYQSQLSKSSYQEKRIMTNNEFDYYHQLIRICPDSILITPQIPLSSIINKTENSHYINELFRTIDFGLFDKKTFELLALIEINDMSHTRIERVERDEKVRLILKEAGIGHKLITLWTNEKNTDESVLQRLRDVIGNKYFT